MNLPIKKNILMKSWRKLIMNVSTSEKFTRQIIDGMYKSYDYIVEDFNFVEEQLIPWGLSKTLTDGTKTVLIFMKLNNDILNEAFENNFCSKVNCTRGNLIKILLISDDSDNVQVQNQLNNIGNTTVLQNNSIILDLISRKIQISDSNMEPIANQIASIMDNNNKKNQNNSKKAIVTYTIIGINIFMFIICAILSGNFMDIDTNVLVSLGAKYNPLILHGQWFRLLTCIFLHGGLIHIAANMYSLYAIGPLVEDLYGKYKYIIIYLATGIISSLFSFWFSAYVSIGASGAIFGLLGVILVFSIKERKRVGKAFFMNVASIVAINLFIGLSVKGIDNFAHLGGLLSGITFGLIMKLNKSK